MDFKQDYFISHASEDKSNYIIPLANALSDRNITYWLDSINLKWGDPLALSINDGLRESRHVIICLSEAFLSRPWPEAELNSAFSATLNLNNKKILPLILNCKDKIVEQYPLIGGLAYREYSHGVDKIADELKTISSKSVSHDDSLHIIIESVHTGRISNLLVPPRSSIKWLAALAIQRTGLKESLDTGGFMSYPIRWVLVDQKTEDYWKNLSRREKMSIQALVMSNDGIKISTEERDRLQDLGVCNDTVFHLYAVENFDDKFNICYCMPLRQ